MSGAFHIIDQLIKQGIDYFCVAPGFRSTPLVLALAKRKEVTTLVHYDERGLGFHALGVANATKKPVALIVTSGTAVGNLMPAVMEASHSHTPLILLTADRPQELRDTMANQTCDQVKFFGEYTRYFFEFPVFENQLREEMIPSTIAQGVSRTKTPLPGPVQFNCLFREPFVEEASTPLPAPTYTHPQFDFQGKKWAERFHKIKKGVILVGNEGGSKEAKTLSKQLGWPLICDILSTCRGSGFPYAHHVFPDVEELKADLVLHLGNPFVSKPLLHWMKEQSRVIHIASHFKRSDPLHCVEERVICPPDLFCKKVGDELQGSKESWAKEWEELARHISLPLPQNTLTEPGIIKSLEEWTSENTALFFGNSMPIRDADQFFYPQDPCGPIFGNRGLSGIDGNIATCSGIAETMKVIAVIGDQSFLHDLNSLCLLKKTRHPVTLIVVNNGGGGIFSFVGKDIEKTVREHFIAAAHTLHFEDAAKLFELAYFQPQTFEELTKSLKYPSSCIIEVFTNRQENVILHKEIENFIKTTVCSFSSTVS